MAKVIKFRLLRQLPISQLKELLDLRMNREFFWYISESTLEPIHTQGPCQITEGELTVVLWINYRYIGPIKDAVCLREYLGHCFITYCGLVKTLVFP